MGPGPDESSYIVFGLNGVDISTFAKFYCLGESEKGSFFGRGSHSKLIVGVVVVESPPEIVWT